MTIKQNAARTALKFKKNSPQILFAAGIVGITSTVVLACRATLKAQKVHEKHKTEIAVAEDHLEHRRFDEDAHKSYVLNTWTNSSVAYVKLYGPVFILGVTSIACLTKSHRILTDRNAAIGAAYAGLDAAFKKYRGRVVEKYGAERDIEFRNGVKEVQIVEYDKDGNPIPKTIKRANPDPDEAFGRIFDATTSRHWEKHHGYNVTFLDGQQRWANHLLKTRGHIFLNEVYDMIGFERTPIGQEIGWVYEPDAFEGDGYVSFGFNAYPDFIAGYEPTVFLSFNVDGIILDKI